jgi:polysaccharide export outer membrane protein
VSEEMMIARRARRVTLSAVVAAAGLLTGVGCEADSYLDPSRLGRWEHTPATVPILDRIASVESPDDLAVEYTEVAADDLIPTVVEYRIGPGDALDVMIADLFGANQYPNFQLVVDSRGYINVPMLGEVRLAGMTVNEARQEVIDALLDRALIVADPVVTVTVVNRRQATFTIIGAVGGAGSYLIPEADYRLLEALAQAGGFPESSDEIFIIRQIALSDLTTGGYQTAPPGRAPGDQPEPDRSGLEDLIEGLRGPEDRPRDEGGGAPGAFGATPAARFRQPQEEREPAVDLPDRTRPRPGDSDSTWVFLDGQWVEVRRSADPQQARRAGEGALASDQLLTQRVIRVPAQPLLDGDMRYNVVIRPGDVVRVPTSGQGLVFMAGNIARPGAFSLSHKLTLLRAIDSAGGLGGLAIPERTEIWRLLPGDRQAAIRINLRAIAEGTQPDLYLKAGDRINIGTNFWAYPLAVVRNGFRVSYGFGFLLDRNFGNDVFGAPPARQGTSGGGFF